MTRLDGERVFTRVVEIEFLVRRIEVDFAAVLEERDERSLSSEVVVFLIPKVSIINKIRFTW